MQVTAVLAASLGLNRGRLGGACCSEDTPHTPKGVLDTYSHVALSLATTVTAKTNRMAVGSISTILLPQPGPEP